MAVFPPTSNTMHPHDISDIYRLVERSAWTFRKLAKVPNMSDSTKQYLLSQQDRYVEALARIISWLDRRRCGGSNNEEFDNLYWRLKPRFDQIVVGTSVNPKLAICSEEFEMEAHY